MFESVSGQVILPQLTEESVRALSATLAGRIDRHLHGAESPPLILLDGDQSEEKLRAMAARLATPRVLRGADLVLATSGSSSALPHLVGLSWDAVLASATATVTHLGPPGQWWLTLPPHHIAGLQVVVRTILSGTSLLFGPLPPASTGVPLYTSLVPTQLLKLRDSLDGFSTILVGGARLDPQLRDATTHLPLVTTYGMTETCGGCVYDGRPLPGVRVEIRGGQVALGGPTLMNGYLDESSPLRDGWLSTSDLGHWENGRLVITGRCDDVIISGGENVSATSVKDAIVMALPELKEVEVFGVPDPQWGHLVCAAVVGQAASSIGPRVRQAVAESLGRKSAPRIVVSLEALPLLSSGKIDRRGLLREAGNLIGTDASWER